MTARVPPPHNLDAEAAVIAAVFMHPAALYDAQAFVGEGAFYSEANRRIWRAITELERDGTKFDEVTVAGWLQDRNQLQAIGGAPYIGQLIGATPAVANVTEHARIVGGHAHRRRLIATLQTAAAEGYGDVGDPFDWAQNVEQRIYESARFESPRDEDGALEVVVPAVVDEVISRRNGKREETGISTGFCDLDLKLNGLKRGKVYVVAGRPGMGKSAIIGQVATSIASRQMFVVEISTEQSREELARRKLAQTAKASYRAIEKATELTDDELIRVLAARDDLKSIPLTIEAMGRPTIAAIRSAIRRSLARMRRRHGDLPIGLICIDQLGHLDGEAKRGENRESEVSRLSREIAWMAGEFDCPIFLAAQLNRGVEQRPDKRPLLSDLRESGSIEQDAFGVLFPFRPEYYERKEAEEAATKGKDHAAEKKTAEEKKSANPVDACELIIAKHKNGSRGSVKMMFHGPSMAFSEQGAGAF